MNSYQIQREYRAARLFTSACFALMMLVVLGVSVLNHWGEVSGFAVHAYENPTQVFSSVVRGVAVK